MTRYKIREVLGEFEIFNPEFPLRPVLPRVGDPPLSYSVAVREVFRLNREAGEYEMTDRHLLPVEPCCGCREDADIYRTALEEIAYVATEPGVLRTARRALGIRETSDGE